MNAWFYTILLLVSFLFVLLFSTTTSPLYEGWYFWYGGDSAIFQEMGYCIIYGKTPYIDFFDHKGPLLFFIQALGLFISNKFGLLFIQTMSLFITFNYCFKIINLFKLNKKKSIIIFVLSLSILFAYFQRGNTSEEWCLPFISIAFYIYFKNQLSLKKTKKIEYFFIGLCIGCIFMIRANSSAPIVGLIIYSLGVTFKQKDKNGLFDITFFSLIGLLTILSFFIILFIVLYGKSCTNEMLYATFLFNLEYIQTNLGTPGIKQILVFLIPILLMCSTTLICLKHKNNHNIIFPLLISYIITAFSCGLKCFEHYVLIFVPLFLISFCLLFQKNLTLFYFSSFIIVLIGMMAVKPTLNCLIQRIHNTKNETSFRDDFQRFISLMTDEEKKSIFNYHGNIQVYYFVEEKMLQCSRIAFPTHLIVSNKIKKYEIEHGLKEIKPLWILIKEKEIIYNEDDLYIKDNYTLSDSISDKYINVYCYRRNDTLNK